MLKISFRTILIVLLLSDTFLPQSIPDGDYFGQAPPGLTPEVFAPDIISVSNRYEYFIGFSPDLKECAFGVTNSNWSDCDIYYTKQDSKGSWSQIILAYFQGNGDGWMPFFTYDDSKLFFSSGRPGTPLVANIWMCEQTDSGWNNPIKLESPVNSSTNEWRPNTTFDGTLYFVSGRSGGFGNADIYKSLLEDSAYSTVENLGATINSSYLEGAPFISPDEDYLIFESWRPGGYGQGDLYVSFFKDSIWTEPRNMGSIINTNYIEDGAYVSPDGKYLFFNRRQTYVTNETTDIYWVDASVIFDTSSTGINDLRNSPYEYQLNQNYPNPFNPLTNIKFQISDFGFVSLKVYDTLGRKMTTLVNEEKPAGSYEVEFDGKDLSSGIYFYRMQVGNFTDTKKSVLMR